ncbi:MAG: glycosyltransferase [archaeon]
MIDIVIFSYNEPNATIRAVKAFLAQKIKKEFRIFVVDPFPETEKKIKKSIRDKRLFFFPDPGEGKSYALNMIFQEYGSPNTNDLFVLTDGDVYVSKNSLKSIIDSFNDKEVGCVTGKPVAVEKRDNKYGFWAKLLFEGIDKVRKRMSSKKKFFECSGYLFAIRKGVIMDFPLGTSEDSIIPYLFWKKGYKIKYVENAEVYVKNPGNWKDWLAQKVRNVKAHENLNNIVADMPRTKSFFNEIREGTVFALSFPRKPMEYWWTLELFGARLYLYLRAFFELRKGRKYSDGWRETEIKSTKPLD